MNHYDILSSKLIVFVEVLVLCRFPKSFPLRCTLSSQSQTRRGLLTGIDAEVFSRQGGQTSMAKHSSLAWLRKSLYGSVTLLTHAFRLVLGRAPFFYRRLS